MRQRFLYLAARGLSQLWGDCTRGVLGGRRNLPQEDQGAACGRGVPGDPRLGPNPAVSVAPVRSLYHQVAEAKHGESTGTPENTAARPARPRCPPPPRSHLTLSAPPARLTGRANQRRPYSAPPLADQSAPPLVVRAAVGGAGGRL